MAPVSFRCDGCRLVQEGAMSAAARNSSDRFADVAYVGKMEAIVFRLDDGRIIGVPQSQIKGLDGTPITRISLLYDGRAALIEQFSGNTAEVPTEFLAEQYRRARSRA
jgi:hypothetical protein